MSYLQKDVMDIISLYESLSEEEQTDENFEILKGLQKEEIEPTLDRYQRARQYYLNEAENIGEEIKRLQQRKKSCERNADDIKGKLLFAVSSLGGKIRTTFFTFGKKRNKVVDIQSIDNIPEEFIKIERKVMKEELKKHILETGEIFDGVDIKETESLTVR